MKPHKHAELIKAWADGAEIEARASGNKKWVSAGIPNWNEYFEYRIKPEKVYPTTSMAGSEAYKIWNEHNDGEIGSFLHLINVAIRRAIDEGQVVIASEVAK